MTVKPFGLEFLEPMDNVIVSPDKIFGGPGTKCTFLPGTTCVTVTIEGTGGGADTTQNGD
jgi:hypothetical protein